MKKLGFIVNPVAGMGGSVALKGTDGMYERALMLGAEPVAPLKAKEFLNHLKGEDIHFITAGGIMGGDFLEEAGFEDFKVVTSPGKTTTAEDTKSACRFIETEGVDLIIFAGGDGTARDVASALSGSTPVLGIPSGVKMFSGVFALSPAAAASIVRNLETADISEAEVLDIDEGSYRDGELKASLFMAVPSPFLPGKRQHSKWTASAGSDRRTREEIGRFVAEIMRDDTLYLVGAGSTAKSVCDVLGLECTLLGVDAVLGGKIVGFDLSEDQILALLEKHKKAKIVLSPIGAQGFVLGRGNQQFSARVIEKAGPKNVIIVATPAKLEKTRELYIDTGDRVLNEVFGDSVQVICGAAIAERVGVAPIE